MKKRNNNLFTPTFCIGGGLSLVVAIMSVLFPAQLSTFMLEAQIVLGSVLGWFAQIIPILSTCILIWLACSKRFGNMKIGGANAKVEYSTFSWIGMLFTASIGGGLITFAVNETLYAYLNAPSSVDAPNQMEAVNAAISSAMYHWGATVWGVFALAGVGIAYFVTYHNAKYTPGDSIIKAWPKKKWPKKLAIIINSLACVCAVSAVSASIGFGSAQVGAGAEYLFNLSQNATKLVPFLVLIVLVVMCIAAVSTKVAGAGMNKLSNINVYLCLGILAFVMIFGPTRFIMESFVSNTGHYLFDLIPRSFETFKFGTEHSTPSYFINWDVSNNMFWVAWAPFMSIFIASISRGRTVRQYTLACLTLPTVFMLMWMSTFGGISMLNTIEGDGSIAAMVAQKPDLTFFMILKDLPLAKIVSIIGLVLIIMFLATTYTSTALSLSRLTDREGKDAGKSRSIAWIVLMSCIAVCSMGIAAAGGADSLTTIRAVGSTVAFAYVFFLVLTTAAFLRRLLLDSKKMENKSV